MSPVLVHLECGVSDVALRVDHPVFPLESGGFRFSTGEAERAEWLVAGYSISRPVTTSVPRERRILMLTEPVEELPAPYVNQFGILVAPQAIAGFRGAWVQDHAALLSRFSFDMSKPGFPSVLTYDELVALKPPAKRDAVSAVVSTKTFLPGHRRRLSFLCALKSELGDRLDIYGRGFRDIPVKADAVLPYKYHLALENTVMSAYWTEKLADAYLGFALPIVSGPPDLARWFPPESFRSIDLDDIAGAVATVLDTLAGDAYGRSTDAIAEARSRVLRDERLCPLVARVIAAHPSDAPRLAVPETVTPPPSEPTLRRVARETRRVGWWLHGRLFAGRLRA